MILKHANSHLKLRTKKETLNIQLQNSFHIYLFIAFDIR